MTFAFDTLALVKLAFGLAAFLYIGWVGARSKRIVGVLLTFPILNGIAMLVDPQPFKVADAIAVLVVLNVVLFWLIVTFVAWIPPFASRLGDIAALVVRLVVWMALWFVSAWMLTAYREQLPSATVLFLVSACTVAASVWWLWRPAPAPKQSKAPPSRAEFYLSWTMRLAFFVSVFCILLFTAQNATDPKWVGMASALPLPGFFAVAYLSTRNDERDLRPIRDTVLFGPLLVIPFNALFAAWLTVLPADLRTVIGTLSLLVWWGVGLALVFWLVPKLERRLDAV